MLTGNSFDLYVQTGVQVGVYSRRVVFIAKGLALVGKLLPRKLERVLQFYILAWLAKGYTVAQIKLVAESMADTMLERCKSATLEQLREHQAAGRKLILISAMLHEVVEALAAKLEARGEGTHLQVVNGRFLNKLDGAICQKEGKAERARALMTEWQIEAAQSYAYGDTGSDIPYLKLFGFATAVDPDKDLEAEAVLCGWTILRTNYLLQKEKV